MSDYNYGKQSYKDVYKNLYSNLYSDQYKNAYKSLYPKRKTTGRLTDAQRELLPYLQEQKSKEERERGFLPFLELVLDILQRGQYVTSNVVEDIAQGKSIEHIISGAWEGLLGKRKGDWESTLFGGQDVGEKEAYKGILPSMGIDTQWAEADLPVIPGQVRDLVGFIANIVLDPTTYLSFGSTKAARAGAEDIALQTVKRTFKNNIDEIAEAISKGFSRVKWENLLEKNADDATEYLAKFANANTLARFKNQVYKKAYKEALTSSPDVIQKKFLSEISKRKDRYADIISRRMAEKGTDFASKTIDDLAKKSPEIAQDLLKYQTVLGKGITEDGLRKVYQDIFEIGVEKGAKPSGFIGNVIDELGKYTADLKNIASPDFLTKYKGLGERSGRFLGMEFAKGQRPPNIVSRSFQTFKDKIAQSPIGSLGKALSAKLDDSVVGSLRRMFGVRNAYQKALNVQKAAIRHHFEYYFKELGDKANVVLKKYDDDIFNMARDIIGYNQFYNIEDFNTFFQKPELWNKIAPNLNEKNIEQIRNAVIDVKSLFDDMYTQELKLVDEGLMPDFEYMFHYLPTVQQTKQMGRRAKYLSPYRQGFTKHKEKLFIEGQREEVAILKMFLGLDEDVAKKLVLEKNWSGLNMDLKEMIYHRMFAHAQAMTNADLVRSFKEFGITFDDLVPGKKLDPYDTDFAKLDVKDDWYLFQALKRRNRHIQTGDIRKISTEFPALKDMYFDRDVADILDKVMSTAGSDEGLERFTQIASNMISWWKAFATLSPGFHARNFKSNIFTLFMKEGISAFNPKRWIDSYACIIYGLYGEEGLLKSAIGKRLSNRLMNRRIGGKTLKEWTDQVLVKEGVISRATKAFDIVSSIDKTTKKTKWIQKANPFDLENFALFKGSHELSSVVESHARVMSFLIDIEKMAGGEMATDYMSRFAMKEAKKWFFDYEDLTDFEKKYMKNIIPFYTWLRKNVSRQVTQIVENREMYSLVPKAMGVGKADYNVQELPEYMRLEGYVPMGQGAEEGETRVFHPDLPYEDLNILPFKFVMSKEGVPIPIWSTEEAWEEFLSAANPVIKTAFMTIPGKGYDPFRKEDLDYQAEAPRALRLLAASPELLQTIDSIARTVLPDGLGLEVDENGKLRMDAKIKRVLEDNFILIQRLTQMGDALSTIFPQIDKAVEEFTGTKGLDNVDRLFKTLSFSLGFSIRDYEQDYIDKKRFQEIYEKALEERKSSKSNIPGYRKRSKESTKRFEKQMKKLRKALR